MAPEFEIRGINHLALVCADMERTIKFYTEVLGFRLVKTLELPGGRGQHFFLDIGTGDGLAFFWFPGAPRAEPGITGSPFGKTDEYGNRIPGLAGPSAHGSMHHVAFDVPLEKMEEYKDRLSKSGVDVTDVVRHYSLITPDGPQDEFIDSLYFTDPDGIVLEFASWTRELTPDDVSHTPARAEDEKLYEPVKRW